MAIVTTTKKQATPLALKSAIPTQKASTPYGGTMLNNAIKPYVNMVSPPKTVAVVKVDPVIQQYKDAYTKAQKTNDIIGMYNASTGADAYRVQNGQAEQNTAHTTGLLSQWQNNMSKSYDVEANNFLLKQEQAKEKAKQENADYITNNKSNIVNYYKSLVDGALAKKQSERAMQESNLASQKGDIATQYDNLLKQIEYQKATGQKQYTEQRNDADVQSQLSTRRMQEYLASLGQRGGENIAQIGGIENARQNAIADIGNEEQDYINQLDMQSQTASASRVNDINKIDSAIVQLKNNGATDDTAIVQELESEKVKALMDLSNSADARERDLANSLIQQAKTTYEAKVGALDKRTDLFNDNLKTEAQKRKDAIDRMKEQANLIKTQDASKKLEFDNKAKGKENELKNALTKAQTDKITKYDMKKPYYSPNDSKKDNSSYLNNPTFLKAYSQLEKMTPEEALKSVKEDTDIIINTYGKKAYDDLIKRYTPKKQNKSDALISAIQDALNE